MGKKVVYVDSNNYLKETFENNFKFSSRISQLKDPIRYYSKNYWKFNENGSLINSEKNNSLFYLDFIDDENIVLVANKKLFSADILVNGLLKNAFDKESWREFINFHIPSEDVLFEDNFIELNELNKIDQTKIEIEKSNAFINSEFVYQFYTPKYEQLINDPRFDILTIPSIYTALGNKKIDERTAEENLFITLGGLIPITNADALTLSRKIDNKVIDYYDKFVDAYENTRSGLVKRLILQKNITSTIDEEKLNFIQNKNFIPSPFYFEMYFSNLYNKKTDFIHVLKNFSNIHFELLNYIKDITATQTFKTNNFIYSGNEERQLKTFDVKKWLDIGLGKFATGGDVFVETNNLVNYTEVIKYMQKNLSTKKRKFKDIFTKPAHSEILFYRIEKRQFENSPEPIQTFWINPTQNSLISLIDNQIKYGTSYFYKIYAYTLIVGNQYSYVPYSYSPLELEQDIENGFYRVKIENKTNYKICEILLSDVNGSIYDTPFTKPILQVNLNKNNIVFTLEESEQEASEDFESIEIGEAELYESIKNSQKNVKNNIRYIKNTKQTSVLQIFRTTTRPQNYQSFQGKLYKTLNLINNEKTFSESILTNIKYYYLFRYLNEHNVPSYPSRVYEVEIVDEDGYLILKNNTLELNEPAKKVSFKNMKKYLLVRPSIIQVQPKFTEPVKDIDNVNLGPEGDTAWRKNFVIRITSKKTNRMLRFDFKPTIHKKKE
jgi:hypothetical protein